MGLDHRISGLDHNERTLFSNDFTISIFISGSILVELAPTIPSEYKNKKDGKSKKDQEEVIRHHEATIQSLEIKVETLESKLICRGIV